MSSPSFSGADLDQLRALSARLKSQSGKMREIASSSTFALTTAEWSGAEIDAIRDQWRRSSLPTLTRIADSMEQLGSDLDAHLLEQERVSGGGLSVSGSFSSGVMERLQRSFDGFVAGIVGLSFAHSERRIDDGQGEADSGRPGEPAEQSESAQKPQSSNDSERNASVLGDWRKTVPDGTRIDWDGAAGIQCVDVVRHYLDAHFPGQSVGGGFNHAYQMYERSDPSLLERIPPGGKPRVGDIIVIGPNTWSPQSGHVAIVDRVDPDGTVHVIQQSGGDQEKGVFTGKPSKVEMDALIGYLRPRS